MLSLESTCRLNQNNNPRFRGVLSSAVGYPFHTRSSLNQLSCAQYACNRKHRLSFVWQVMMLQKCSCVPGCAVPSSSPVAVPARRQTSTSEEHALSSSMARATSTERSLLSQQIRVNSGSSLHSLNNGTHHAEARLREHTDTDSKCHHADETLPFPTSPSPEASVPDHSPPPFLNGGSSVGLQGGLQQFMNGGGTQHSSAHSQHQTQLLPETNWEPDIAAHQQPPMLVSSHSSQWWLSDSEAHAVEMVECAFG